MKFLRRARRPVQVDQTQDYRGLGYTDQRKIARDSNGNLYLAYRKKYRINGLNGLLRYHIFVARSSDSGSAWTVLNDAPIARVGDYVQRVPTIAIDANDLIHVAWYGNDADNTGDNQRQIKYARSTDAGASWSNWINVAAIADYNGQRLWQEHPCIAAHRRAVYLVWQGLDATYQTASQVKFAASLDGGSSWGAWQNVSPPSTGNRSRPTLVVAEDGARLSILAYGDVGGRQQIVWTCSTDGGNTWAAWAGVSPADSDQRHVSVASDRHGALHAVWRQADATGVSRICYARYNGRAWSARALVGADQQLNQFFPSLTVTSDDTLWVAWTAAASPSSYPADDPVAGRISYAYMPRGGRWSSPAQLANGGDRSIYASLRRNGLDNDSAIDLVWLNNDGANLPIYHTRLAQNSR